MRKKNPAYYGVILDYIEQFMDENVCSPSNAQISAGTGLSTATVSRYMQEMRDNGTLNYSGHRGIITKRQKSKVDGLVPIAVLNSDIACGSPIYAEENIEEYIQLPESLIGKGDFFILRAKGDSMANAGIGNGDEVLIRKQDTAEDGDIVAALIGEEATLKRYFPDRVRNVICLHPENDAFDDIYVHSCTIQGVAVMVFKHLQ